MDETNHPDATRLSPVDAESLLLQRPWTVGEVCAWVSVSPRTLDELVKTRGFPRGISLGGKEHVWRPADVLAWVAAAFDASSAPVPGSTNEVARPVLSPGAVNRLGVATRRR